VTREVLTRNGYVYRNVIFGLASDPLDGMFLRIDDQMRIELPAGTGQGFLRHKSLILVAAGGAVAEVGALTFLAPGARSVAPQLTALPSVAAYHDLRWIFADGQSWIGFAAVLLVVLVARAAMDATLLRLAWPRELAAPRFSRAFGSCLALTALCWVLLSPAVTLAFGVAVLPFSWPFLGALPIILGVLLVLSHGGTIVAWWRRLPPPRAMGWLVASFAALTAAGAAIAHLGTAGAVPVAAVAGLVNARAWYGMAQLAARVPPRSTSWVPGRVLLAIPFAPLAGLLVLVLVVGVARLMFTGTIRLLPGHSGTVSISSASFGSGNGTRPSAAPPGSSGTLGATGTARPAGGDAGQAPKAGAVLVVEGWGSWCCDAANGLRALEPGMVVRQFSYRGLDAAGNPVRTNDNDVPLPELGDKIAEQLEYLHRLTHSPVDIVAESEGTLGVYAMLARHPGLPLGSVTLLSPIVEPGQLTFPVTDASAVPPAALAALNHLVGRISPYGGDGARELLASVSQFGAEYFSGAGKDTQLSHWLAVIPLADALTLPACTLPGNVVVVPAFHGGLLGDPDVLRMVARFIAGMPVASEPDTGQARLRAAAEVIAGSAVAWRMPDVSASCPSP
jgi:hypothetical protein